MFHKPRPNYSASDWEGSPIFLNDKVTTRDWSRLILHPEKWLMYRFLAKHFSQEMSDRNLQDPYRVLQVGCGTGDILVDLKKMFGRRADVVGVDKVKLALEVASQKAKKNAVSVETHWYEGEQLPFSASSFDAVYWAGGLSYERDISAWLLEVARVLKPGGVLAIACATELGAHAYLKKYFFNHGLNLEPEAEQQISLYSQSDLKDSVVTTGFEIKRVTNIFWADFWVNPEKFYAKLHTEYGRKFWFFRQINKLLVFLKKRTYQVYNFVGSLYSFVELYLLGAIVKGSRCVILAQKNQDLS